MRTPYNLILANFAAANLFVATFGATSDALALIYNGWTFGKNICFLTGVLVTTSGKYFKISKNTFKPKFNSKKRNANFHHNYFMCFVGFVLMLTQGVLSVCRLSNFVHTGLILGHIPSYSIAIKIILIVWLYACSLSLPPVFGWGNYTPEMSGLG